MALPAGVRRAFQVFLPGRSLVEEVDEEIAFHLAERTRALVAEGYSPAEAAAEARRRFGDLDRHRHECRAQARRRDRTMRRHAGFADLAQDVGFALRQLVAHPGFSIPAVLTLALGIGATTALFSAVYAVVLRPLPWPDPARVVWVWEVSQWSGEGGGQLFGDVSAGNFTDWRRASRSFEALAAVCTFRLELQPGRRRRPRAGRRRPGHRRLLRRARSQPAPRPHLPARRGLRSGHAAAVVLSDGLWRRRFGADPEVVGTALRMNGEAYEVVGVIASRARQRSPTTKSNSAAPMVWTAEREAMHDEHAFPAMGRLAPGVSARAAEAELRAISDRVRAGLAEREADQVRPAAVHPLLADLVGDARRRLLVLPGAVGLVLLIACANVANLQLARGAARRRELAVRAALGARRRRLVRQMLTESLVLGLAGGAAGVALAYGGLPLLLAAAPPDLPRLGQASVDGTVLGFAVAVALVSGVIAGLVPAFRGSNVSPEEALREAGAGGAGAVVRRDRLRASLVAVEVALAVALLVGAGLLLRTGAALARADLGFEPGGVVSGRVTLPAAGYPPGEPTRAAFGRLLEEIGALPGVAVAAVANQVPLGGASSSNGLLPEGRTISRENLIHGGFHLISPGYFEALGVRLVRGRRFSSADRAGAPKVMIVNEALARTAWPGEDPIGKRIACCEDAGPNGEPPYKEVIGVVGDVRFRSLARDEGPAFYLPLGQEPDATWSWIQGSMAVIARTAGDPAALGPELRRAVTRFDPDLPLYDLATLDGRRARALASERFNGVLLTLFGALGLMLAAIGVYGILAFFVGRRTRELGVRIALGASGGRIFALVLAQSLAPVVAGVAVGLVLALGGARLLASQLYGVAGTDSATFVTVAAVVALVAAVAAALPARRALAIEPARALRVG